jgi:hypothetical protein
MVDVGEKSSEEEGISGILEGISAGAATAASLAGVALLIPFKKLGAACSAEARSHGCIDQ